MKNNQIYLWWVATYKYYQLWSYINFIMAVLHRALATWGLVTIFLIMLTLKLDERTEWDWFIIFTPMWIFDTCLFFLVLLRIIVQCKNGHDRSFVSMPRKLWYMTCVMLKLSFQVTLCLRLQYYLIIPWYYTLAPLWALLGGVICDIFKHLVSRRSYWVIASTKFIDLTINFSYSALTQIALLIKCINSVKLFWWGLFEW